MRRVAVSVVIVFIATLVGASAAGAKAHAARGARGLGVLVPARKGEVLPRRGGTADSLNWSGYAVTPGSGVTAVSSTFTVPSPGWCRPDSRRPGPASAATARAT